jgi:hypothetical protein
MLIIFLHIRSWFYCDADEELFDLKQQYAHINLQGRNGQSNSVDDLTQLSDDTAMPSGIFYQDYDGMNDGKQTKSIIVDRSLLNNISLLILLNI